MGDEVLAEEVEPENRKTPTLPMSLNSIVQEMESGEVFCMTSQRMLTSLAEIVEHADKGHWLVRKRLRREK